MAEAVFAEEMKGLGWQMSLLKFEAHDSANLTSWVEVCNHIARQCQLQSAEQVQSVCVLNWAAPAVFSSATQCKQAKLLGGIVNSGGDAKSIGLVLTPSFFYKKGSLYKTIENGNKLLAAADLNMDTAFAIAFESRNDDRQKRSLLQPGSIVLPGDPKKAESTWQAWKSSDTFKFNLIKDAPLPLSAELVEMEDMSDASLPQGTDDKTHPAPAEKFQQIGQGAAFKLLSATLSKAGEGDRKAILVVDLSSRTLDVAKAAYELRKSVNAPLYYVGFGDNEEQIEWQQFHMSTWLAQGFLDGSLPLPAGAPPLGSADLPAELVSAMPTKPDLGTLTWSTKKQDGLPTLKTPDKVLQTWHDHTEFGAQFQDWLKKTKASIPLDIPDDKADSKKRNVESRDAAPSGAQESQAKKPRQETVAEAGSSKLPTVAVADVPSPLCWTAQLPLPAKSQKAGGKCTLIIAVGRKIFLANEGNCDVNFNAGQIVAGYWKGSWQKEGSRNSDVLFELKDANDLVILEGKTMTLSQCVLEKRAVSPLAVQIRYHDLVDKPTPEDSKFFEVKLKSECQAVFRPENVPVKEEKKQEGDGSSQTVLPYTSVAGVLPTVRWADNLATRIVWSVKWTARGLGPIRPNVCLREACQIKPGHAICFQQADA